MKDFSPTKWLTRDDFDYGPLNKIAEHIGSRTTCEIISHHKSFVFKLRADHTLPGRQIFIKHTNIDLCCDMQPAKHRQFIECIRENKADFFKI